MIERAIAAGVPFAWVAADSVYGVGEIEMALRRAGKGYVLGVNATRPLQLLDRQARRSPARPRRSRKALLPSAWQRLSAGEGTKGPRLYDWAYLELADLEADEYDDGAHRPVDARPADPPPPRRWRAGLLLHLVPGRHPDRDAGRGSKGSAGRSRTRSRPRRPSSGSTTTRPAPGTAGTGMSRW